MNLLEFSKQYETLINQLPEDKHKEEITEARDIIKRIRDLPECRQLKPLTKAKEIQLKGLMQEVQSLIKH